MTCQHENVNHMSPDNAVCLTCGHHWWQGKEYAKREWDAMLRQGLMDEKYETWRDRKRDEIVAGAPWSEQWIETRWTT